MCLGLACAIMQQSRKLRQEPDDAVIKLRLRTCVLITCKRFFTDLSVGYACCLRLFAVGKAGVSNDHQYNLHH